MRPRLRGLAGASLTLSALAVASANAAVTATLHVSVSPERLGASTTMRFSFAIAQAGGGLPPALTILDVQMPPGMGIDTQGLQTCTRGALVRGPRGCSASSQVGTGSVLVRVPLGESIFPERAALSVFNGPRQGTRTTLLFYAAGRIPIATQLIFTGIITPGSRGPLIGATIPLIPTLPQAPDASIVELSSTLGTRQHAYYRIINHQRVRFTPKGATLPAECPSGALPFSARFQFNDMSATSATSTITCPR